MQPAAPAGDPTAEGETHDQPAPGTLAWFEVATSDPDGAEKFYGSLFDWTFEADGPAASGGMDYRNIKASGADGPMGGIFGTGGQCPTTPCSTSWSPTSRPPAPTPSSSAARW